MNRIISKKVAIIGAGQSGLASAKYAAQNGLSPVIFDKANTPGGLWASNREHPNIWENLHSNITTYSMSYSDHFFPKKTPLFASKKDVHNYLLSYSERFQLDKFFRLRTSVDKAVQLNNSKWQIETTDLNTNAKSVEEFDHLIVASGLHLKPRFPDIENKENFKGKLMHSSHFKLNDEGLKSKRVLVVGCSHSGADISSQLAEHASRVMNVFRRPYLITRRFVRFQKPEDKKGVFHIIPVDMFTNTRGFKASSSLTKEEKKNYYLKTLSILNLEQTSREKSHPELFFDLEKEAPRIAISDNYYGFVKQGKILPKKSSIKRFENDGVIFEDGSYEKTDVIIFCTGYDLAIDYLSESIKKELGFSSLLDRNEYRFQYLLYKSTFHPSFKNLAMVYQNEGIFLIAAELQARWASLVFSGKLNLPDNELMQKYIQKLAKKRELKLNQQYPYGSQIDLIDELAKETGLKHDFEKIKKEDPILFSQLWNNVALGCHFRLDEKKSIEVLDEIQKLVDEEYIFDDDIDGKEESINKIALRFGERQSSYKIPIHLFKT